MKIRKYLAVIAVLLVVIGILMVGYSFTITDPANAAPPLQTNPGNSLERTITVIGEGRVKVNPDIAQVTIGVESFGSDIKMVGQEVETTMTNLVETLKAQGVPEKDIQTSNYSVYTERFGPMEIDADSLSYRFSNNVTVIVRDLSQIETILGAVIEAGANNIYGVNFSVEDPATLRKQARAEAVTIAKSKAEELAQLNGVTVGEVVTI